MRLNVCVLCEKLSNINLFNNTSEPLPCFIHFVTDITNVAYSRWKTIRIELMQFSEKLAH